MFQKRRGEIERGKKAGAEWQRVVNTPSGEMGGGLHPSPLPVPGMRVRPLSHSYQDIHLPAKYRNHRRISLRKNRAKLGPSPSITSSHFFFFLKSLHLFSFCPHAPAGVFIPAGCWVIYLLALLSILAGVFQVGSLNSSEPRARGGVRWVVLISSTLPKKPRVSFLHRAAAALAQ